jgi:conjugative transfer signal peptidase TraF
MPGRRFNRRFQPRAALLWAAGVFCPTALTVICGLTGMRFNATPSVPIGLYWISSDLAATFVEFCPPQPFGRMSVAREYRAPHHAAACADGGEPLLKPIIARPGDLVEVSARGIVVNGEMIPNSIARVLDSAKRPLQQWAPGVYRVEAGTVWAVSFFSSESFDSRYFGPIRDSDIRHRLRPIWTAK